MALLARAGALETARVPAAVASEAPWSGRLAPVRAAPAQQWTRLIARIDTAGRPVLRAVATD